MGMMSEFDSQSHSDPEEEFAGLAIIGSYDTARLAHEAGLAVLASGHHYWVHSVEGRFVLAVPREYATLLKREVEIAELRNRFWPPASLDLPARSTSKIPTVMAIGILMLVFYAQNAFEFMKDLGVNSSEGVLVRGEWGRLLTAVTLHADISHISGNILGISIFAYLCCRYMGNGLAWLLILLTAGLSNLTNDLLHAGEVYFSLGASTAVFAALGLLTGFPIGAYFRTKEPIMNRDWLIPFFGGCILFAWMGGGEFPTDVAGHFWSFLYGLGVAAVVAWSSIHTKLTVGFQRALLAATVLLLVVSWSAVLSI